MNQKPTLHKLAEETKALEKNVSPDIEKTYKQEFDDAQGKWNELKVKVSKDLHLLEEITPKLRTFEVNLKATRGFSLLQSKVVIVNKYLLFEQFAFFLVPCLLMYLRWDIKFHTLMVLENTFISFCLAKRLIGSSKLDLADKRKLLKIVKIMFQR